jgi:hypothetical protein
MRDVAACWEPIAASVNTTPKRNRYDELGVCVSDA